MISVLVSRIAIFILCAPGPAPERGLIEAEFNQVLDTIQATYAPIISRRGVRLVIERRWHDNAVNSAPFSADSFMGISISGGMARAPGMTQDALALVACHELGHLLGGAPRGQPGLANEGQADYFATAKCLRRVFAHPGARWFSRLTFVDSTAQRACRRVFPSASSRAICVRSAMAALSASPMTVGWGDHDPSPSFATPDPFRTMVTDDRHMPRQCRLDTQFQGALCSKPATEDFSEDDPVPGACTRSEHFTSGLRPRCWYRSEDFEAVASSGR